MNKLEQYLTEHVTKRTDAFAELEDFAIENRIPIMEPVSMNFLTQLVRIHQPETILELGTAIGYSALRMLEANPAASLTTIEKDVKMYELAQSNIAKHKKQSAIVQMQGDALEVIAELVTNEQTFDFIFIDAAKAQYQRFFDAVQPLTKKDTMIVCDNILFKGYVVDESKIDQKRLHSLTKKIQQFNAALMQNPNYHSSIVPIGDGVSISIKLNK